VVTHLSRRGFRKAPAVFFQNPEDRQLFLDRAIVRAEQARLLPGSGVDLDRFAPALPPEGPLTFLLIARLVQDKGVLEFVEAARSLRDDLPDARFQLLGGPDEGHRTAISLGDVNRWAGEGVIEYVGSAEDVRPFIASASAVVLPSYREGLPRSLLEGAAMARPLIGADAPGCREVVEEGVNGYLCKVRDARSLAEVMLRFARLPQVAREAMGAAARRTVEERFSEELVVRAYQDVLDEVTSS
jgi:glycosyltransferase involved in cell wall biosynthesis